VFAVDARHDLAPIRQDRLEGAEPVIVLDGKTPTVWLVNLRAAADGK
jgi:hypothetical protein